MTYLVIFSIESIVLRLLKWGTFGRPLLASLLMNLPSTLVGFGLIWQPQGCLLRFTELSAFAGMELVIQDSAPFQLALPLFKSCVFSRI